MWPNILPGGMECMLLITLPKNYFVDIKTLQLRLQKKLALLNRAIFKCGMPPNFVAKNALFVAIIN